MNLKLYSLDYGDVMKLLVVAKKLSRVVTNDTIELTQETAEIDTKSVAEQYQSVVGGEGYYNYAITKADDTVVYYKEDDYLIAIRGH